MRRRLFVVPLANNDHGKTTLVRSLLSQGERRTHTKPQKSKRTLYTPWTQEIDAYVFVRSFQEVEKKDHPRVRQALDSNDPTWFQRDLIIMPSHLDQADCSAMVDEAHAAGFDAVAVRLLLGRHEVQAASTCMALAWDARWTIDNSTTGEWEAQVEALGRDLWGAISATLFVR